MSNTDNDGERYAESVTQIRERLEEERDEALDHLEQESIENPDAAYWGGRYYLSINFLLWLSSYDGPVFQRSESFGGGDDAE